MMSPVEMLTYFSLSYSDCYDNNPFAAELDSLETSGALLMSLKIKARISGVVSVHVLIMAGRFLLTRQH